MQKYLYRDITEQQIRQTPLHIFDTILNSNAQSLIHTHDFYEIFIIKSGSLNHLINDESVQMNLYAMCFVEPSDIHSFKKAHNVEQTVLTNIAFSCEYFKRAKGIAEQMGGNITEKHINIDMEIADVLLKKIEYINDIRNHMSEYQIQALSISLLAELMLYFNEQFQYDKISMPLWLHDTCTMMRKEENFIAGMDRFVALSGKTQEHLTRTMKKFYRQSPSEYVNTLRLHRAGQLLIETNLSVTDIFMDVGFFSISHALDLFKKKFGITPLKYRNTRNNFLK